MSTAELPYKPVIESSNIIPTKWWVVTAGPSSGKTSVLEYLASRGYQTKPEAARVLIDREMNNGRRIEAIRANERNFQLTVHEMKERMEREMSPEDVILLDRGIEGDSFAYNGDNETAIPNRRYAGIFLLDELPFQGDYARTENEARAREIHLRIGIGYRVLGYRPIRVPVLSSNREESIELRGQFIIDHMRSVDPSIPDLPAPIKSEYQLKLPV